MVEEKVYKIRLVGRNYVKDKCTSYDVYGITIPFPEFFGKKSTIKKVNDKTMMITILDEKELEEIENEKLKKFICERKRKKLEEMRKQNLITPEQETKYMADGVELPSKPLVTVAKV